jgi:hypothetical protein
MLPRSLTLLAGAKSCDSARINEYQCI